MEHSGEFKAGGKIDAVLDIENTEIINWNFKLSFMYFTVPVFIITLLLNMSVLLTLWKPEKTVVNKLIVVDSIINILLSTISTFMQSPYYRGLGVDVYCSFHLICYFFFTACNRLIPVAIVLNRYDFCRQGSEDPQLSKCSNATRWCV